MSAEKFIIEYQGNVGTYLIGVFSSHDLARDYLEAKIKELWQGKYYLYRSREDEGLDGTKKLGYYTVYNGELLMNSFPKVL